MTQKLNNRIFIFLIPFFLGLITSFSLPPYSFLIINFISFPILFFYFVSNFKKNKWISFKIGWFFGFGYFISNIYWITNSLTFEEIFKPLIPIALIIIPLFLGLFYGCATFICSFFNIRKNFYSILVFSTIFAFIEFIRGFILSGFPWNLISYSWVDYLSFLQILPLIGTYSFNLLSISFFLVPTIVFFDKNLKLKIISITFSLILLSINYFYGSSVINKYEEIDNINLDTTIKVISPKIGIDRFFQNEDPSKTIEELIQISSPNKEKDTIFVFPEGILTSIYLEDLKIYKKLFTDNYSNKHKIILGINSNEKSKIFNSLVILDNQTNILAKYNKNRLVPFGEFLPFESTFSKLRLKKITHGYRSFSSDKSRKVLKINNINFLPLICYEIIYSGKLKKSDQQFDFIINISEDGWFGNSIGPHQHFSHSIFRSIEEGKNLIRSANNGISAYINPIGQVINKIESTHKGVIQINNFKKTKKTLFARFGNKIFFYFILFYISLIFFLKIKNREIR